MRPRKIKVTVLEKSTVSIIVCLNNEEAYIKRCIDSILKQTYENLQIIIVDDGSYDKSAIICDEYIEKDNRIEVYHIENGGIAEARNYGITKAKGDYILFVDGDDWVKKNYVSRLVDCMEKNDADMVICRYFKVWKNIFVPCEKIDDIRSFTGAEYLENTLKDAGHHYFGVIWNKIYKRKVINDNNLCFKTGVRIGEDFIFNINYWGKCRKVVTISDMLYYYNKSSGGISQNREKNIESCQRELNDRKQIYFYYAGTFESLGLFDKHREEILFYLVAFYIGQCYDLENTFTYWEESDKNKWREIIEHDEQIHDCLLKISDDRVENYRLLYTKQAKKKSIKYFIMKLKG